ncbi:MAG: hypothetical protein ACE5LF_03400 [Alphaproteobacteria bacterium]
MTTALAPGLTWDREGASTAFNLRHTYLDRRQEGSETADVEEASAELTHTLSGAEWEITGRLAAARRENREVNARSTEGRYETGIAFSLRPADLPDITASFDLGYLETESKLAGGDSLTNRRRVKVAVAASTLLPVTVTGAEPFATLTYRIEDTDTREALNGKTGRFDHALLATAGLRFRPSGARRGVGAPCPRRPCPAGGLSGPQSPPITLPGVAGRTETVGILYTSCSRQPDHQVVDIKSGIDGTAGCDAAGGRGYAECVKNSYTLGYGANPLKYKENVVHPPGGTAVSASENFTVLRFRAEVRAAAAYKPLI